MNQYGPIYVTQSGLQKMQDDLNRLVNVKLVEANERLQVVLKEGDLSENANYDFAKQEQSIVEGRIRSLEDALRRAEVLEEVLTDSVGVGNTVTITELEWDECETYRIVGVHEADPLEGLISNESPIGSALLGGRVGQTVVALTPGGEMHLRIDSIA